MNQREMTRWEKIRTEQALINDAAKNLRHQGVQQHYVGLQRPELAYGLAAILDTLSLHWNELPAGVRAETMRSTTRSSTTSPQRNTADAPTPSYWPRAAGAEWFVDRWRVPLYAPTDASYPP